MTRVVAMHEQVCKHPSYMCGHNVICMRLMSSTLVLVPTIWNDRFCGLSIGLMKTLRNNLIIAESVSFSPRSLPACIPRYLLPFSFLCQDAGIGGLSRAGRAPITLSGRGVSPYMSPPLIFEFRLCGILPKVSKSFHSMAPATLRCPCGYSRGGHYVTFLMLSHKKI